MTTAASVIVRPEPSLVRALGGAWRLTWRRFLVPSQVLSFTAILIVLAVIGLTTASHSTQHHYLEWVADFYGLFLLPLLALIAAGGAIRDDYQAFNVDYVFTRPIDRAVFTILRFASHTLCTVLMYLGAAILLCLIGLKAGIGQILTSLPWLIAAQSLTIVIASAFGFLFGALTKRYVIIGLMYAGIVEVGIGQIPTQLNQISMLRHIRLLYGKIMPGHDLVNTSEVFGAVLVVLITAAACVTAAALLTRTREFAGSGTRDS